MRSSSGVKDVDDFELLRAWQAGDRRAGSELVQRNFQVLFRFFRNKIDDNPTDIIQQTLITCVEVRDRVPEGVSFRAYALGVARNKLLHHLRAAQRQANAMQLQATAADLWFNLTLTDSHVRAMQRALHAGHGSDTSPDFITIAMRIVRIHDVDDGDELTTWAEFYLPDSGWVRCYSIRD